MRVLVCGSRNWTNKQMIREKLENISGIECVIEGEANGADKLAREVAEELGIPVYPFPANWKKYGKAAGPMRNKQMLNEGKPDVVLAFHADLSKSKGTRNMLEQALKRGLPIRVYGHVAKRK